MGDIHVHTAPHAFETEGYTLWCRADSTMSIGYLGLALAEGFVAYTMVARSKELPWGECKGGEDWWRRKFMLIVMLVPVTLLRFYNMFVWAEFNCDVSTGQADIVAEDHHKLTGDWLNAITFWYYLAVKSLFLLAWMEIQRSQGKIRWRIVYLQLLGAMGILFVGLGIPQTLAVYWGGICEARRENDFCRKYFDVSSLLAVVQALAGLSFGVAFGRATWNWAETSEYEPIESLRLNASNRDSYGSSGYDSDPSFFGGGASGGDGGGRSSSTCSPSDQMADARRYSGVAYCIFFSIVAHSAFNMYFSFYAVGGLGMLGNTALISLTMLKTVAVEIMPVAWACVTVYNDATNAEKADTDSMLTDFASGGLIGGGAGGMDSVASTPPAGAYQIE